MIKRRGVAKQHNPNERIIIVVRVAHRLVGRRRSMLTRGGVGQPHPQNQQEQKQRGKRKQRTQMLQQGSTPLVGKHINDHPPREELEGGTKHQGEVEEPRLLMIRKRNMSLVVACQH
jgi:hypothetical protein